MFLMLTEPTSKSVNPICIANTSVAQYKKNTASTFSTSSVTCISTEESRARRDARRAVPRRKGSTRRVDPRGVSQCEIRTHTVSSHRRYIHGSSLVVGEGLHGGRPRPRTRRRRRRARDDGGGVDGGVARVLAAAVARASSSSSSTSTTRRETASRRRRVGVVGGFPRD